MPVTSNLSGLNRFIDDIKLRFDDPGLIRVLGQELSKDLTSAFSESGLQSKSGATIQALSTIGEPEKVGRGWRITVGDKSALGSPDDPAPRGTLRKFYDYLEGTGRVHAFTKWSGMSRSNKELLQEMRRAGLMGGRGPRYANYMWVQNYGSAAAEISGRHFIERGQERFRSRASSIINDWWKSSGHIGTLKVGLG